MVQSLPIPSIPPFVPPAHLSPLPHLVLDHELAPRNVGWPSVSAGPDATQVTALRGRKLDRSPALALLDALDEVLGVRDPHALFRIVVQVSQRYLGLQSPALLLVDDKSENLCGTWRSTPDGRLIDERAIHVRLGERHLQAEARARSRAGSFSVLAGDSLPRVQARESSSVTVLTPILGRDRLIGFLENVAGPSESEPQEAVQMRAAILCRALGGLLDDIERRARSLPWDSLLVRRPNVPRTAHQTLVASVLRALHDDASISSGKLALSLRVSTSQLSTVFRDQTGVSLTQYRNRLRIERFFTQVDPTGGNLLQAAFQAGFGSYPQFHRVFRELLDATPRDYLSEPEPFLGRSSGCDRSSPVHDSPEVLLATG